jgi:hypothetical protein
VVADAVGDFLGLRLFASGICMHGPSSLILPVNDPPNPELPVSSRAIGTGSAGPGRVHYPARSINHGTGATTFQ